MKYKIFKIIDNNGMCVQNSEVDKVIRILYATKGQNFIFQSLSDGIIKIYGVIKNILFSEVVLIKTENCTLILDYI